jgi:hypothetical protein
MKLNIHGTLLEVFICLRPLPSWVFVGGGLAIL